MRRSPRRLPLAFFLALLALAGCGGSAPPAEPTRRPTLPPAPTAVTAGLSTYLPALRPEMAADLDRMVNATRYDLSLLLNPQELWISGQETVRYTNQEGVPLDGLYFRLYPNYPGCSSALEVLDVRAAGRRFTPSYELFRTVLSVPLDPPLQAGETLTLQMQFEVQIPAEDPCRYGDLNYEGGILALAHLYPQVAVYDDSGWSLDLPPDYGDLLYADASLYHVTMTLPAGWVVAASGTEIARLPQADDRVTLAWVAGPARDFYLAMSPGFITATQEVAGVRVTSYFLPEHRSGGQLALNYAVQALPIFEERFGPYRYRELEVVETVNLAGGIEYPGIVVVNSALYDSEGTGFEVTTVHEVAHQWWYNLVGNDQVNEPWVDEALTTYSVVVYFQEVYGDEAAQAILDYYLWNYRQAADQGRDAPVNQPIAAYTPENYGPIVYTKGAMFYDALRREIGDQAFWFTLQRYYQRHLYGLADGDDLFAIAEEVAGRELDALYQSWVLSPTVTPP